MQHNFPPTYLSLKANQSYSESLHKSFSGISLFSISLLSHNSCKKYLLLPTHMHEFILEAILSQEMLGLRTNFIDVFMDLILFSTKIIGIHKFQHELIFKALLLFVYLTTWIYPILARTDCHQFKAIILRVFVPFSIQIGSISKVGH